MKKLVSTNYIVSDHTATYGPLGNQAGVLPSLYVSVTILKPPHKTPACYRFQTYVYHVIWLAIPYNALALGINYTLEAAGGL